MKTVSIVQKVLGAAPLTALTQISNGDIVLRLVPMQGRKRKVSVYSCYQPKAPCLRLYFVLFLSNTQLSVAELKELTG